jgi:hypothetical protein
MATNKTQLANMALVKLGKARLTDVTTDTTEEAVVARLFFDEMRDQILDEGPWTFSIKRSQLGQLASTPEFEYDYEFQLPTDCLRVLEVNETTSGAIDYKIEGRKLLTNDTAMEIQYISQVTDVSQWSASFKRAFIARMAAEMSYHFRSDKDHTRLLFQQYEQAVQRGLATDGKQGSNDIIISPDLSEIR